MSLKKKSKMIDIRDNRYSNRELDSANRDAMKSADRPREHGGPRGPEPTRYGDWERNGRCSDF